MFRVCLIFYAYDSANFKSIGNNTTGMLLLRWPCLLQDVLQQTFTVQNKPAAVAKGNHHPSFLRFWNWAEENCRCSQICGGAENVVKTETQQTFVNGLLGFITLSIALRWKRVCIAHNNCMSCPSIWATLSALLINTSGFLPVVFA